MIDPEMPRSTLADLRANYNNTTPSWETSSANIVREHLQEFLDLLPENCDAIKISLIRYPLTSSQDHIKKMPSENFSQVSVILVPGTIVETDEWNAEDLPNANEQNKIHALLVAQPVVLPATVRSGTDTTDLCPPKPGCKV